MRVLGADGAPDHGWVVAELDTASGRLAWHHVRGAAALLELAAGDVLAADVPIGLPDSGTRACDRLARERLRGGRASSVFAAPPRAALAYESYACARAAHPSLSAQTFALVPRIRDVDTELRADPGHRVLECHPEVSLRLLAGRVLPGKKTAAGALERLALLQAALGPVPTDVPSGARLDDALDALACAWTARRVAAGQHETLGGELDVCGLSMRIVV